MNDIDNNDNPIIELPIEQKILKEENPDELQDLIDLFNLNMKKKDIVRSARLSEVQDKIVDQMSKRVETRPDEFSNADLLNYHKTVQETLSKSDNTLDNVKVPSIQINQQFNVNNADTDSFDKESRERILNTVNEILDELQNNNNIIEEVKNDE